MLIQIWNNMMSLKIVLFATCLAAAHSGHSSRLNAMELAYQKEISELQMTYINSRSDESVESKVTFYLFTRNNDQVELKIDAKLLHDSKYNVRKPTKFIIHGFFNSVQSKMAQRIKNNILQTEDVNVIIVDWSKIAKGVNYITIAKKTRDVGLYFARLLDLLVRQGSDRKSFHLIGHSLGAHVAGFAGAAMSAGRPGRITGLDPAKPEFHNEKPENRLDRTDADFVDCIHTCGGLLGLMEPLGHVDFYPNGGTNVQPGCHFYDFGRCSHSRSHHFFAESVLKNHVFSTQACSAIKKDDRFCMDSNVRMGYYLDSRERGLFFGVTGKESPYAPVISQ